MYCKYCGKQIADDSIFCSSCGASQDLGSANAKRHEQTQSSNENGQRSNKLNMVFFIIFVILISMHVHYSISYANYKNYYTVGQHNYSPIYHDIERFAGCGYNLSSYEESSEVKELMISSNIFGSYISTLGFQDKVIDYTYMYYYQCYINTYDISNLTSILGNNDKVYERCLSRLAQITNAKAISITNGNIKAITWYGKGSVPTKYLGLCANERLYIIAAQSEKNLEYRSDWLFSLFDFTYYPNIKSYITIFLILGCLIGIFCILFFAVNTNKYIKLPILNRYAFSLFIVSVCSIVINAIIAIVISNKLDDMVSYTWQIIILIGADITAILSSLYLSTFYFRASKMKWDCYYLVPSFLKSDFYNNMLGNKSKRSFIKWVCYPMMIFSLLPFGAFIIIIYSLPLFMYITYKRWQKWACASQT